MKRIFLSAGMAAAFAMASSGTVAGVAAVFGIINSFKSPGPMGQVVLARTDSNEIHLTASLIKLVAGDSYTIVFSSRKCSSNASGRIADAVLNARQDGSAFVDM